MSNKSYRMPRRFGGWGLVLVLFATAWAAGQVRPLGGGRALDANPRVGGGGQNLPGPIGTPINSQLYVTGQVSGLRRFRGTVGYFGENELRLSLPSASLGDFRRQSTGLQDVLQGPTYEATPYYDRTTTTLSVDDIVAGRGIPGTTVPGSVVPLASPLGQRLYVNAMADFRSVGVQVPGMALTPPLPASTISARASGIAPGTAGPGAGGAPTRAPAWAAPSLFGVARGADQAELAQELYSEARRRGLLDSRVEARVDSSAAGTARRDEAATTGGPIDAALPGTDRTPSGTLSKELGQPPPDDDVFMDLMFLSRPEPKAAPRPTTLPATATAGLGKAPAPVSRTPRGTLVTRDEEGQFVLHSLAGRSRDAFNLRMTRAEKTLRQRRYYDAVRLYEQAGRITPRNPLARIGMGMSLLGAGETLSAAHQLQRALSLFPPMMQSRIDLDAVLDAKVIDAELATIDERLRTADDETKTMLRLLAVFLYANAGEFDKAKPYAEKIRDASRDASLLRAYAEFVLKSRDESGQGTPPAPKKPPAEPGDDGASP